MRVNFLPLAIMAALVCGCDSGAATPAAPPSPAASRSAVAPAASRSPAASLAGKVIVIDPGHNGGNAAHPKIINRQVDVVNGRKPCNTTGTSTNSGYPEHAFTWDVANRLARILRKQGARVVLTRGNDTGVGPCVDERARIGNRAHADAVLAIHGDGAPSAGHGFHIIVPAVLRGHNDAVVPVAHRLGLAMRDAFHRGTGIPYSTYLGRNGIDVRSDLGGLNVSTVPAVFIECGNMRNAGDAARMESSRGRQQMAAALANGFAGFLTRRS